MRVGAEIEVQQRGLRAFKQYHALFGDGAGYHKLCGYNVRA